MTAYGRAVTGQDVFAYKRGGWWVVSLLMYRPDGLVELRMHTYSGRSFVMKMCIYIFIDTQVAIHSSYPTHILPYPFLNPLLEHLSIYLTPGTPLVETHILCGTRIDIDSVYVLYIYLSLPNVLQS